MYSKSDLKSMPTDQLASLASEIFNNSLYKILPANNLNSFNINNIIKFYENSIFNNDEDTINLLNNSIDYDNAISIIKDDDVINLRWLKSLKESNSLLENRRKFLLKYPIEKVLIVEGITEEILLPVFSQFMGYDFYGEGVQIIPAGGKNQVVKLYYKLAEELKIPIFLLLDKDAEENIAQIKPRLRNIDKIHLVSCGEFEDLLPKSLIVKTFNNEFKNFTSISENEFKKDLPTAKILEELYKTIGLHEFKKADFAKAVKTNIYLESDISEEIKDIISEIKKINLDT